jgi:hypothetical protein
MIKNPLLFAIFMLASCGPHMKWCGARGICETPSIRKNPQTAEPSASKFKKKAQVY